MEFQAYMVLAVNCVSQIYFNDISASKFANRQARTSESVPAEVSLLMPAGSGEGLPIQLTNGPQFSSSLSGKDVNG